MAYAPAYRLGIPKFWVDDGAIERGVKAQRFAPNDPPIFESEAAYLKHHNLLDKGEAIQLPARDFGPEALPDELLPE